MGAGADYLAVFHNDDLVGVDDGAQSVSDNDYRAVLGNRV